MLEGVEEGVDVVAPPVPEQHSEVVIVEIKLIVPSSSGLSCRNSDKSISKSENGKMRSRR